MSSTISAEAVPTTNNRASGGRFAVGNPGGPGNPFARQTAALRAALVNGVTPQDIQDILHVLLLNAKGGHLPSIKFLFAYVIGKPKPAVEPDMLDLQEMQMLQQSAVPPEAMETLCGQLPLDFQVQLAHYAQAENATAAIQTAQESPPTAPIPQPQSPSVPSADGDNGTAGRPRRQKPPSTNGKIQRPPKWTGFDWLKELRRAVDGRAMT